ncbi:hypothetical protein J2Z79_001875 [Symbiobacterium terraclitae]|uniref:Uncharacterized protein n=1 Tax=Symbiobacterium terraclitae TaxID=557451 RepID=A0ABS4JSF2_9FIRM|nr:hypothetical protein [Symbiobacterium terraclitae]MBP2018464.1 hypothetical protein [Symbiobacterium terraclitae]
MPKMGGGTGGGIRDGASRVPSVTSPWVVNAVRRGARAGGWLCCACCASDCVPGYVLYASLTALGRRRRDGRGSPTGSATDPSHRREGAAVRRAALR